MAESKMKEVAKLLGIEMGVPFKIKNLLNEFMIDEYGLYSLRTHIHNDSILVGLLCGNHEIEQPILDEVEKRYIEGVLKPFKDRVEYIKKCEQCMPGKGYKEYIEIVISSTSTRSFDEYLNMPFFDKGKMYKGMKVDKEYTLEELGLFE